MMYTGKRQTARYAAVRVLRFFAALLLFIALSVYITEGFENAFRTVDIPITNTAFLHGLQWVSSVVLHVFCFYSVFSTFLLQDAALCNRFCNAGNEKFYRKLIRFPEFPLFVSGVVVAAFRYPEVFSAAEFSRLCGERFGWLGGVLYILTAGVTFVLTAKKWRPRAQQRSVRSEVLRFLRDVLFVAFVYVAFVPCFVLILPMLTTVWWLLSRYVFANWLPYAITAAVLFALTFGGRYCRAFFLRRRFLKDLASEAKAAGYCLSAIRRPYASLFSAKEGDGFTLSRGAEVYSCRMLAFPNRTRPVTFLEDGTGKTVRRIRLRRRIELAAVESSFTYAFSGEGKKIIVMSPAPHTAALQIASAVHPLDVGDRIGEYVFFTGSGLTNAVRRDCLGRYHKT